MLNIIINADDCGKSRPINNCIQKFIEAGKLTSTTIMANMDDLDGAIALYKSYQDKISFGIHLNLTEGNPILHSDILLQKGLYIESSEGIKFNINSYRNRILSPTVLNAIEKELDAQIAVLKDFGVKISHIDSHHHIHTGVAFLSLLPRLARRHRIYKIRSMRNYIPLTSKINLLCRDTWWWLIKGQFPQIRTTDYFGIYEDWYETKHLWLQDKKESFLELMCHPGGVYESESENLLNTDFLSMKNIKLISYNDL